ncbi:hypothetical protein DE146DRAFT_759039 [Phaeosphaeria sp. MPI-PUGE-AT-0046c]|nr:hypothetical protein DE146DRAFT_759039 [Phaeosphaeria sp. MPI-PUGE-AT-0046c]
MQTRCQPITARANTGEVYSRAPGKRNAVIGRALTPLARVFLDPSSLENFDLMSGSLSKSASSTFHCHHKTNPSSRSFQALQSAEQGPLKRLTKSR